MTIAEVKKSSRHAPHAVRPKLAASTASDVSSTVQQRLMPLANGMRSMPATLRRGMTLVELLVVVTILFVVAAMMVPRLPAMMDHARVREAARAIQLYLSSARNQAMSTGRSCGVMIEPLANENGCSMVLSQVETPSPYGGDSLGSTISLTNSGSQPVKGSLMAFCLANLSPQGTVAIHPGDLLQVGYQGYWLNITSPSSGSIYAAPVSTLNANMDISHGEMPFWFSQPVGVPGPPMPYKILRWPTKTSAAALQLPAPAVIDLYSSGCDPINGSATTWPVQSPASPSPTPVMIMFSSDGRIDWISYSANPSGQPVTTPIYLLVGLRNKVNPASPKDANINDFNSLWIAINPTTGLITVADLASTPANPNVAATDTDLNQSRALARQASANSGK